VFVFVYKYLNKISKKMFTDRRKVFIVQFICIVVILKTYGSEVKNSTNLTTNTSVALEGGGKITTSSSGSPGSAPLALAIEGQAVLNISSTNTTSSTAIPSIIKGREGVTVNALSVTPSTSTTTRTTKTTIITSTTTTTISPEVSSSEPQIHKTVPKTGVNFTSILEELHKKNSTKNNVTTTTTTTTIKPKPKPRKPLITVPTEDEPYLPSHFQAKSNASGAATTTKVIGFERFDKPTVRSTDYVIPIVIVILSIPLVAILLNLIYKRTKEWWHHRHYRRMDFLIDGMYNN